MKEELTTDMQSEFMVSEEDDLKHRVWAALRQAERYGESIEESIESFGLTMEIVNKYKDTRPV